MKEVLTDELLEYFADKYITVKAYFELGLNTPFLFNLEQFVERQLKLRGKQLKRGVKNG